jgi:hypothetical protein
MNLMITPTLHVWTSPNGGNPCRPSFDSWKGEKGSRYFVFLGYIYVALKRPVSGMAYRDLILRRRLRR